MTDFGSLLKPAKVIGIDKLRVEARRYPCVLCGKHGFTVAAHSNELNLFPRGFGWIIGKGIGTKAPGYLIAYLCGDPGGCHDQADGRAGGLSREEKREMWNRAYVRTVALWWLEGLIRTV